MNRTLIAALASALAACGTQAPSDARSTTEEEGLLGRYYFVKVSTPVNGSVDSTDGRVHCVPGVACAAVKYGWSEVVTLTATPAAGYAFQNWAGDCSGRTCVLTTASGHFADFTVVAVFNDASLVGHGDLTSHTLHAPAFYDFLAGKAGAASCPTCHGSTYAGQGIAPSCNACHQAAGWADWKQNCSFCHGGKDAAAKAGYAFTAHPEWAAPPDDVNGRTTGVNGAATGAHQAHVVGTAVRGPIACVECHLVPATAIHTLNLALDLPFGPLSTASGALTPTFDKATLTCNGTYCHGATRSGGTLKNPIWSDTSHAASGCQACHATPPASHGSGSTACGGCHGAGYSATTVNLATHVDGTLQAAGGACDACHWFPYPSNPPTVTFAASGAHAAHYGLTTGQGSTGFGDLQVLADKFGGASPTTAPAAYAFGCGNCHPVDVGAHSMGSGSTVAKVVLFEAAAPAGSLKARNAATAAYDAVAKTCSGVYCHSSGQATPAFLTTPGWSSGAHLGCGGCHGDPPRYANGGTATANSHIGLADDGYEYGHYMGVTGPFHSPFHGNFYGDGNDSSPMTCQTCHFDTTDPAATGPSGFYWLDTTGNYRFPGAVDVGYQDALQCLSCHGTAAGIAAGATTRAGAVLPLRHVDGKRDVVFDPRTSIPAFSFLPAAPARPTKPYWTTSTGGLSATLPAYVTYAGTTVQFDLTSASYDPATKTCSAVGCHIEQTSVTWGTPYVYYSMEGTCFTCHQY